MPEQQQAPLQAVAACATTQRAAARPAMLPMQADWQRMFGDITDCGPMNMQLDNGAVAIACNGKLRCVRCQDGCAVMRGPGLTLAGLTGNWALASIVRAEQERSYQHLEISDHLGTRLLRMSLTGESRRVGFHALLVKRWACRGKPITLPDRHSLPSQLHDLARCAGKAFPGELHEDWFDAERRELPGRPFDVSLLSPFLETLADQMCPLRLVLGNPGLLQQRDAVFYSLHHSNGTLVLRGDDTQLSINLQQVTAGRVAGNEQACHRCVRLYDEQGRCVCAITPGPTANAGELSMWQAMLRALIG